MLSSPRGQVMATYLPGYYASSTVMQGLLQAEGAEVDALREALGQTLDQFFVRTATWGLESWEREMGLALDGALTDAERRDRIISQLRGYGTATIAVVKSVAEAYDKGTVDVIEDHGAYRVTIWFVDTRGVPPNVEDLKAAVRGVLPAHLDVQYRYHYLLWDELDAQVWTWDQVDGAAGGPPGAPLAWDAWEVAK